MAETSETNSVDVLTSKCEAGSLDGEALVLCAVHKLTSERRLPSIAGEKVHREIDDHVRYDIRCESCDVSRVLRRLHSEFYTFNYVHVKFKETSEYVTVLIGKRPRCD